MQQQPNRWSAKKPLPLPPGATRKAAAASKTGTSDPIATATAAYTPLRSKISGQDHHEQNAGINNNAVNSNGLALPVGGRGHSTPISTATPSQQRESLAFAASPFLARHRLVLPVPSPSPRTQKVKFSFPEDTTTNVDPQEQQLPVVEAETPPAAAVTSPRVSTTTTTPIVLSTSSTTATATATVRSTATSTTEFPLRPEPQSSTIVASELNWTPSSTPAPVAIAALPTGWVELHTDQSNDTQTTATPYYYHAERDITTWDRPVEDAVPFTPTKEPQTRISSTPDHATAATHEPAAAALPPGWVELRTSSDNDNDDGTLYYLYEPDGTTTWDRPTTTTTAMDPPPSLTVQSPRALEFEGEDQQEVNRSNGDYGAPENVVPYETATALVKEGALTSPTVGLPPYTEDGDYYYGNGSLQEHSKDEIQIPLEQSSVGAVFHQESTLEEPLDNLSNSSKQQQQQQAAAVLPPNWEEVFDPDSGLPFYVNGLDGTTTWDRPSLIADDTVVDLNSIDAPLMYDDPQDLDAYQESLSNLGNEEEDPYNNRTDDINHTTTELTSSSLTDIISNESKQQQAAALLPPNWEEVFDPDSGLPFYVNGLDGTTTWDRPSLIADDTVVDLNSIDAPLMYDDPQDLDAYQESLSNLGNEEEDPYNNRTDDINHTTTELTSSPPPISSTFVGNDNLQQALPPDWEEVIDTDSGLPFHVNGLDGTTTWDRSTVAATLVASNHDSPLLLSETKTHLPHLAQKFQQNVDNDDLLGDENLNSLPDSFPVSHILDPLDRNAEALPPEWEEVMDPDSGLPFYVFGPDGTTTWDKPTADACTTDVPVISPNADTPLSARPLSDQEIRRGIDQKPENNRSSVNTESDFVPYASEPLENDNKALPPDWEELMDLDSGSPYYIYGHDGTTTWERPSVLLTSSSKSVDEPISSIETITQMPTTVQALQSSLEIDDRIVEKSDVNSSSFPATSDTEPVVSSNKEELPSDWEIFFDPDSGLPFYVYGPDGTTSWEWPPAKDASNDNMENEPIPFNQVHEVQPRPDKENQDMEKSHNTELTDAEPVLRSIDKQALPTDWEELIDSDSGLPFYLYGPDGTATWNRPEPLDDMTEEIEFGVGETVIKRNTETDGIFDPVVSYSGDRVGDKQALHPGWEEGINSDSDLPLCPDGTTNSERLAFAEILDETNAVVAGDALVEHITSPYGVFDPNVSPDDVAGVVSDLAEGIDAYSSDDILPSGWVELLDKDSGVPYFLFEPDGSTSWERPVALPSDDMHTIEFNPDRKVHDWQENECVQESITQTTHNSTYGVGHLGPMVEEDEFDEGDVQSDDLGAVYNYVAVLPHGWVEKFDDASGRPYYMCEADGTTAWVLPNEVPVPDDRSPDEVVAEFKADLGQDATRLRVDRDLGKANVVAASGSAVNMGHFEPTVSDLPEGWIEAVDETTGMVYYVSETLGSTRWDRPTKVATEAVCTVVKAIEPSVRDSTLNPDSLSCVVVAFESTKDHARHLPPGWIELVDPSTEQRYFYHKSSDTTSWEWPSNLDGNDIKHIDSQNVAALDTLEEHLPDDHLPNSWIEVCDPSSGQTYFYNKNKNLTSWERPTTNDGKAMEISSSKVHSSKGSFSRHAVGRPKSAFASFGFGGRLCRLRSKHDTVDVVVIYRTCNVVPRLALARIEFLKQEFGIIGPLNESDENFVAMFLEHMAKEKQNPLWGLINTVSITNGYLKRKFDPSDPSDPYTLVINLLLEDFNSADNGFKQELSWDSIQSRSGLITIEKLLMRGERETAIDEAISCGNFTMALLIATLCSRDVHHRVAMSIVDKVFPEGHPLGTVATIASVKVQGYQEGDALPWDSAPIEILQRTWKRHLALLLKNPIEGWHVLVVSLGDRLADLGDVTAAHFCYMVGGSPISLQNNSRMTLIGCAFNTWDLLLATDESVYSFIRTESYEWTKRRGKPDATLPSLQGFKTMYATLLADFGFEHAAKCYVDSIFCLLEVPLDEIHSVRPCRGPLSLSILTSDQKSWLSTLASLDDRLNRKIYDSLSVSRSDSEKEESEMNSSFVTARTTFCDATITAERTGTKTDTRGEGMDRFVPQLKADDSTKSQRADLRTTNQMEMPLLSIDETSNRVEQDRPFKSMSSRESTTAPDVKKPIPSNQMEMPLQSIGEENNPLEQDRRPFESMSSRESTAAPDRTMPTRDTAFEESSSFQQKQTAVAPRGTHVSGESMTSGRPVATKVRTAPVSAPANLGSATKDAARKKSIFHFGIKERLAKLMNPDATVVGDLGDNMKAYYDEEKKVWVFPGEDPAEVAKPIAPPPTTPIQSVPLKPTTTNDPLAAMMAPPPRRGPSQSSLAMRPSPASMPVMFSPKVTTTEPKTVPNIAIFAPQASSSEENKHKIKINR